MSDPSRPAEFSVTSQVDQLPDWDTEETAEWQASLDAVVRNAGPDRAVYLLRRVHEYAARSGLALPRLLSSDYINTIPASAQPVFPGDVAMESRITAVNRWNAAAMVTRGSRLGLGGHIATYASAAWLYEVGFNHFFQGKDGEGSAISCTCRGMPRPASTPACSWKGASTRGSWTTSGASRRPRTAARPPPPPPAVAVGVSDRLHGTWSARRHLPGSVQPLPARARGIKDTSGSRVWAFLWGRGNGRARAMAALALAARERLDNLTFVINCNLQRLDGPVRSNSKIVQELEGRFRGAGWNVVKSLWGEAWDHVLRQDTTGALVHRLGEAPDAQMQTYAARTPPTYARISSPATRSPASPPGSAMPSSPICSRTRAAGTNRSRSMPPIAPQSSTTEHRPSSSPRR